MWPFRSTTGGRARRRDASSSAPRALGRRGEKAAARLLRRKGMRILARNYACRVGEVDLIAEEKPCEKSLGVPTICFVEVKTRRDDRVSAPESAVDARKQQRIDRTAAHYLLAIGNPEVNVRFDIVSVVILPGRRPRAVHLPDAFG
jgi:putative endonuclease